MGNVTSGTIPVAGDGDYFIRVTAVNIAGAESNPFNGPEIAGKILQGRGTVRGT
jgi:hypothetical protein